MTEAVLFGISCLLIAFGLWEYLAIRKSLESASRDKLDEVTREWRMLGIFLSFIFLANLLFLFRSLNHISEIPQFFMLTALIVGSLFIATIMLLFRITLTRAIKVLPPGHVGESNEEDSWRDPLTDLHNERAIHEALKQAWHRSERYKRPLAVVKIDLDEFAKVVDEYGQDGADSFLKDFSEFLKGQIRVGDTAARIEGGVFLMLLPEEAPASARRVAERIRKSISEFSVAISDKQAGVTASMGVANNKIGEFKSFEELIRRSEYACSAAKKSGRNRVVGFSSTGERKL